MIILAHNYTPITTADRTYTPVSDVTPDGTAEEKLTWANIVPNHDTWLELTLSGKIHWCDWLYGTKYTDDWDSVTKSDRTYREVTS